MACSRTYLRWKYLRCVDGASLLVLIACCRVFIEVICLCLLVVIILDLHTQLSSRNYAVMSLGGFPFFGRLPSVSSVTSWSPC